MLFLNVFFFLRILFEKGSKKIKFPKNNMFFSFLRFEFFLFSLFEDWRSRWTKVGEQDVGRIEEGRIPKVLGAKWGY